MADKYRVAVRVQCAARGTKSGPLFCKRKVTRKVLRAVRYAPVDTCVANTCMRMHHSIGRPSGRRPVRPSMQSTRPSRSSVQVQCVVNAAKTGA